jgi:hypothetical protein
MIVANIDEPLAVGVADFGSNVEVSVNLSFILREDKVVVDSSSDLMGKVKCVYKSGR